MSADLLRQAAALMRERAEAATPGPWVQDATYWTAKIPNGRPGGEVIGQARFTIPGRDDRRHRADATHIASWHPAVALAVADWLDRAARLYATSPEDPRFPGSETQHALNVARAYLGTPT